MTDTSNHMDLTALGAFPRTLVTIETMMHEAQRQARGSALDHPWHAFPVDTFVAAANDVLTNSSSFEARRAAARLLSRSGMMDDRRFAHRASAALQSFARTREREHARKFFQPRYWPITTRSFRELMLPDIPLAAAPSPFVQDFIAHDRPAATPPSNKRVHLDFEAGVGGYAASHAQKNPDAHVITIDDGTLPCSGHFNYVQEKDESGRTSFAKLWRVIHDAVRALSLNAGLERFTEPLERRIIEIGLQVDGMMSMDAMRRDALNQLELLAFDCRAIDRRIHDIRAAADSGAFDYWGIEREAIEYSLRHHVAALMAAEGRSIDDDKDHYWKLFEQLKTEVFLRGAKQTYGMWRSSYADRIRRDALNEAITPEEVFMTLQRRYLEAHFNAYAPAGEPLPNMTVMRAPTAVESGFNGIPLPTDAVHSITWIGPFRHADDHRAILDEFKRILAPDWTSVEIGIYDRDPELDFPQAALAYGAQIFGTAAKPSDGLIHPLQGSMFDASNLAFHCYTNAVLPASQRIR